MSVRFSMKVEEKISEEEGKMQHRGGMRIRTSRDIAALRDQQDIVRRRPRQEWSVEEMITRQDNESKPGGMQHPTNLDQDGMYVRYVRMTVSWVRPLPILRRIIAVSVKLVYIQR